MCKLNSLGAEFTLATVVPDQLTMPIPDQDDAVTPTSRHPPHSWTPYIPLPPISPPGSEGHNVPELDDTPQEFKNLPPSSPIHSPGSIALPSNGEADLVKVEDDGDRYCSGQWVQWTPGPIWNSYPYQRHDRSDLPWVPIGWKTGWIQIRSLGCDQLLNDAEKAGTCRVCIDLLNSRVLARLMSMASTSNPEPRTPWNYLTTTQLKALLLEKEKKIRLLHVQVGFSIKLGGAS